ncbi:MAG: MetQ/NlpA family ABC transporter substrate-binding protein [Candidatus Fimadaptatus sp.]
MKKFLAILLTLALFVPAFAMADDAAVTITIGATPSPHVEILEAIAPQLEAEGIKLNIVTYTDYIQPNDALAAGDLDANYFQHKPYMDDYNTGHGTALVALIPVHYEPMGLFPGKTASLEELADGASVAVPNDTTNEARALLLLEANGLITLREGAGMTATKLDIVDNPKNLDIQEIEAAQIPRVLVDVDLAVINGNYAVQAGLNVAADALAKEESDSLAAETYVNYIVVNGDNYDTEVFDKLAAALTSEETRQWITDTYGGSVVPFVPAETTEDETAETTEG